VEIPRDVKFKYFRVGRHCARELFPTIWGWYHVPTTGYRDGLAFSGKKWVDLFNIHLHAQDNWIVPELTAEL
jgi:hypothetical protein